VLEWIDPPFASGHWIPELVEIAGGMNTIAFKHAPSREVSWEKILASGADIIVVAECGFGIARQQEDIEILLNRIGSAMSGEPSGTSGIRIPEIWVCDGSQYFSRPGPRLVDTVEMLAGIFHTELRGSDERSSFFSKFRVGHDLQQVVHNGNAAL
jgi:iron complex transport system substrate-binding protein